MSKPRYGWWPYVKDMLRRYPDHTNDDETRAIESAILDTENLSGGRERMKVIQMVFFKKTHTLQGAALNVPCSYETAKEWTQQFIRAVARAFKCDGLLQEYPQEPKKHDTV